MKEKCIVSESNSPWSSPIVLVKKKDSNQLRFCIDFRWVDDVTSKDVYLLPLTDDVLDTLKNARYFSTLDQAHGYWQIPVTECDKERQHSLLLVVCTSTITHHSVSAMQVQLSNA